MHVQRERSHWVRCASTLFFSRVVDQGTWQKCGTLLGCRIDRWLWDFTSCRGSTLSLSVRARTVRDRFAGSAARPACGSFTPKRLHSSGAGRHSSLLRTGGGMAAAAAVAAAASAAVCPAGAKRPAISASSSAAVCGFCGEVSEFPHPASRCLQLSVTFAGAGKSLTDDYCCYLCNSCLIPHPRPRNEELGVDYSLRTPKDNRIAFLRMTCMRHLCEHPRESYRLSSPLSCAIMRRSQCRCRYLQRGLVGGGSHRRALLEPAHHRRGALDGRRREVAVQRLAQTVAVRRGDAWRRRRRRRRRRCGLSCCCRRCCCCCTLRRCGLHITSTTNILWLTWCVERRGQKAISNMLVELASRHYRLQLFQTTRTAGRERRITESTRTCQRLLT
jgi:hypothetical protein